MWQILQIFASNPPSILMALGGIGILLGFAVAWVLLVLGVGLQVLWLIKGQ
jgi:hypothetical protein